MFAQCVVHVGPLPLLLTPAPRHISHPAVNPLNSIIIILLSSTAQLLSEQEIKIQTFGNSNTLINTQPILNDCLTYSNNNKTEGIASHLYVYVNIIT